TKPIWANLDKPQLDKIRGDSRHAIDHPINKECCLQTWDKCHPERAHCRREWGDCCRDHCQRLCEHEHCFDRDWCRHHDHCCGAWDYHHGCGHRDCESWWGRAGWRDLAGLASPGASPISIDYGSGGNVTYEGNSVNVGGQPVASREDYARSGAELATPPPPA